MEKLKIHILDWSKNTLFYETNDGLKISYRLYKPEKEEYESRTPLIMVRGWTDGDLFFCNFGVRFLLFTSLDCRIDFK